MKLSTRTARLGRWLLAVLVLGGALVLLPASRNVAANGVPVSRGGKGDLFAWGSNGAVQIAFDPQSTYPNPVQNTVIGEIVAVSGGGGHTLALKADGTLWAWGNNAYGQLGDGTTGSRFQPKPVSVLGTHGAVLSFSSRDAHSVALTADGTVWAWGWNSSGQLGIGTAGANQLLPVPVKGPDGTGQLAGVRAVAAESRFSAALKTDGTVWAWGWNPDGELGNAQVGPQSSLPVQVANLSNVVAIALGFQHGLALKQDGTMWAWGGNAQGQLGDGTTTNRFAAVQVSSLGVPGVGKVKAIAAGTQHSLALLENGTVYSWGFNGSGQLGIGPGANRTVPVAVNGISHAALDTVIAISASGNLAAGGHNLALLSDGTVAAWGDNGFGQAGDGTSLNDRYVPVLVQATGTAGGPLRNVIAIDAGFATSMAIVGPTFGDLAGLPADAANAITQLAARGVIKGCDQEASPPLFCPNDQTLRAQMAALIVRAMVWGGETPSNAFTDKCDPTNPQNCVDDELWNAVGVLAAKQVAKGYTDGATCAPATAPCYAARDAVLHAQVISFVTRAMVQKGYWTQATTDNGSVYPNIPVDSGHRLDFVTYTQNVGPVPGTASATQNFDAWNQPSTRAWFAQALWLALQGH